MVFFVFLEESFSFDDLQKSCMIIIDPVAVTKRVFIST